MRSAVILLQPTYRSSILFNKVTGVTTVGKVARSNVVTFSLPEEGGESSIMAMTRSSVFVQKSFLLLSTLTEFAKQASLQPPFIPPDLPSPMVDYLLRLAVHPYTTDPQHPALCKCKTPSIKNTERTMFQVSCI